MQGLNALKEEPLIIKDDRVCQWDGKKPYQFGLVSDMRAPSRGVKMLD